MSSTKISEIHAREIIDSRGNPTVEVDVRLAGGGFGRAAVPSGASTGEHEAWELRDGVKDRYGGKGVHQGRRERRTTRSRPSSMGFDALDQVGIDKAMIKLDGTPNKTKLGANAILGVSLATAKAAADSVGQPLFKYLGGTERQGAARADDEHHQRRRALRCPDRFPGIHDHAEEARRAFSEALREGAEIFHALKGVLKEPRPFHRGRRRRRLRPEARIAEDALDTIAEAVKKAGYKLGKEIFIALDRRFLASSMTTRTKKPTSSRSPTARSARRTEMVDYYAEL